MSHRASGWLQDLPADAMNATSFRVLFHLAAAHNHLRHFEEACFPQQSRLLEATGLSNGGLNNALNALESANLIKRIASTDQQGRRRTYYILGCDFGLLNEQTPNNGVCPNSTFQGTKLHSEATPNSNSVEFDTKAESGIESGIEEGRCEEAPSLFSAGTNLPALIPKKADHFPAFWEAYPKKIGRPAAEKNFRKAVKDGANPERIVEGAKRYAAWLASAKKGEFRPIPKHPQGWLTDQRWEDPDLWLNDGEDDETAAYRARMRAITESANAAQRRS